MLSVMRLRHVLLAPARAAEEMRDKVLKPLAGHRLTLDEACAGLHRGTILFNSCA